MRLRSGYRNPEPYPLNQFPPEVIKKIAYRLAHLRAVGHTDIRGKEFERVFADAIGGKVRGKSLGVADLYLDNFAWSVKTVKIFQPHKAIGKQIRLISGRNSPVYSKGIENPFDDLQKTGAAVIEVYNNRIAEAHEEYDHLRFLVLIRNFAEMTFTLYERSLHPFPANDYHWIENSRGNFEAYRNDQHRFTWQPHGSQFTILETVPRGALRFRIAKQVPVVTRKEIMRHIGWNPDWVEIVDNGALE